MGDPSADWWSTSISDISPGVIRFRGYAIEDLIGSASFPDMIWLLLRGELPTRPQSALLERALVSGVDHGPQAPSIAIARSAMTCGVGINNAVASAVNVLGDVHGGAGQELMEVLYRLADETGDAAGDEDAVSRAVEELVSDYRGRKAYVPGFGHRFHAHDPRRDPLLAAVDDAVAAGEVAGVHLRIGREIERRLAEGRTRPVPMNVDGATAIIYAELGFSPELGRGLFVLSRSVGALAHAWEESGSGMRNKGPIPRDLLPTYTGEPPREVPRRA
ncbi:MAG: citryl-CoA lyase [Streptosporangiales bacterium]|nr:citryl-CoA lyase [Streptosporangiales bacterium]